MKHLNSGAAASAVRRPAIHRTRRSNIQGDGAKLGKRHSSSQFVDRKQFFAKRSPRFTISIGKVSRWSEFGKEFSYRVGGQLQAIDPRFEAVDLRRQRRILPARQVGGRQIMPVDISEAGQLPFDIDLW